MWLIMRQDFDLFIFLTQLLQSLTHWHLVEVYDIVSIVGYYHKRGLNSRALQLQVNRIEGTVEICIYVYMIACVTSLAAQM